MSAIISIGIFSRLASRQAWRFILSGANGRRHSFKAASVGTATHLWLICGSTGGSVPTVQVKVGLHPLAAS